MKEREVKAIKKIKKRLNESKMQTQESLVIEDAALEASLVTEGVVLEESLVTKGISLDASFVVKQSTSEQHNESNSSRNKCSTSANENRSYDNESSSSGDKQQMLKRYSLIRLLLTLSMPISDLHMIVTQYLSTIIFDIPNMDPDRGNEEHDYVDYEKQHGIFASLINNLQCDVENVLR
nr:hypothetical protein [Tanacetum cinerariifolium]